MFQKKFLWMVLASLGVQACSVHSHQVLLHSTKSYQEPALLADDAQVPIADAQPSMQKEAHAVPLPSYMVASPFLAGVRADDVAMAQARVKPHVLRHWSRLAKRSTRVRARLLRVLHELDVPEDLQVIPVVESAYRPYALSRTGAMGLWQLMPRTAQSLGIHHSRQGEGRRHVEISTRAAAQYLRTQYQRFGNWPLAFAAYNMGPNGLARRLNKTPWQLKDGLMNLPVPRETRNYVVQIIGMTALLHLHVLHFPQELKTVPVDLHAPVDIQKLEQYLALPKHELFRLNPQLHYRDFLNHDIRIDVPQDTLAQVQQFNRTWKPRYIHIRVHSGDSLWKLAHQHQITVARLKRLNPTLSRVLHIGQTLTVPAHGYAHAVARINPLLSEGRRIRYKVRQGDSLWSISRRFGTTTQAIARANQLTPRALIRPGDTLWVFAKLHRPS